MHCKCFTASKQVNSRGHALRVIERLRRANKKAGYGKYFGAILYSDSNEKLEFFRI